MWMRSCAVCKALIMKIRLRGSIRVDVGGSGSGRAIQIDEVRVTKRQRLAGREVAMARVIEFYVPKKFRRKGPSVPQSQPGKVIVFCLLAKNSA